MNFINENDFIPLETIEHIENLVDEICEKRNEIVDFEIVSNLRENIISSIRNEIEKVFDYDDNN